MIGKSIGAYQILAKLGEGGMGEVYRAHDSRLRRDVAVKVLPPAFATDDDRLRRFEQEAHATAALNHPNILAVYDIGRAEGTAFVVTELLEGQTMRDALATGALPVRKVLNYAAQIASGLAAAHEKGIVHRDLKPENLFVTRDERVKILDFGLAKLADAGSGGMQTQLAGHTEPGMVLGTIGYMSPEQVRGQAVDHRADIFSFGAVLFELLTGQRAFKGDTAADTMTAILKEAPPDMLESGRAIPAALARVVDRCLEKNPAVRFQSASDLAFALQTLGSDVRSGSTIAPAPAELHDKPRSRAWITPVAALLAGGAITAAVMLSVRRAPEPPPFLEADIAAPPGHTIGETSALSPDGTRLALTAADASRKTQLWLRTLESGALVQIGGTDDARNPFWSPDGTQVGFFATGRLRVVTLATGRVRVICDVTGSRTAGTWNQSDVIVFASETNVPLKRVNAKGTGAAPVDLPMKGLRPHFLPDGRHFLFHDRGPADFGGVQIGDLDSPDVVRLGPGRDAVYADGYLLVVRGLGVLQAQPFDPASRTLTGEALVVTDMGFYPADTGPNYSVAGRLIALRRQPQKNRHLVWYARDGARQAEISGEGSWANPSLSPDDSQIAAQHDELQGTGWDVWVIDSVRNSARSVSTEPMPEDSPIFSIAGDRILFKKVPPGATAGVLVDKPLDGSPAATGTVEFRGTFTQLTPDGKSIVAFAINSGNRDIIITPRDGKDPPKTFAQSPFNETQPAMSPDGHWIAYVSDELGATNRNVYVQAYPGGGHKMNVSIDIGGVQPRWRRDGKELYFVARDGYLMSARVESSSADALRIGPPQKLFPTTIGSEAGLGTRAQYDATRDGKRFIISEPRDADATDTPFTLLMHWRTQVGKGVRPPGGPER